MVKATKLKKLCKKYLKEFIEENELEIYKWDLFRIRNRIMQGACFEPSGFDKYTIYLNFFIQPLFIPINFRAFVIGGRINDLTKGTSSWQLKDEKSTEKAFKVIRNIFEKYGSNWLNMTCSSAKILESIERFPDYPYFIPIHKSRNSNYSHDLGYIALDAGRYDKAKIHFNKYLKGFNEVLNKYPEYFSDEEVKRKEEVNRLLSLLDNPKEIRRILYENTRKTAEALKIKLEEW